MAEIQKDEYKFPDEQDQDKPEETQGKPVESDIEIEVEDDTPAEDRNRTPADPAKVKALEVEVDDLDKYSKEAKDKLIRMKRVWNDERRRAEFAERERNAAVEVAQRLHEENKLVKQMLHSGAKESAETAVENASTQLKMAKKAYKEAYDAGDSEALAEAQEELTNATIRLDSVKKVKPEALQEEKYEVQTSQQYQPQPPTDPKLNTWQRNNPWFGQDEEMTAAALGLHEKLKRQGAAIGSDEYYATLDNTMRKRFPENFEDLEPEVEVEQRDDTPKTRPASVVAPATRTTAPKRIKLKTSQVAIAKKLGLTPEQYVRELLKLEA
jgi:rubrerythrin